MKKLFFSAVALVAFSSVSMANTIAVEEVKLETTALQNNIESSAIVTGASACVQLARNAVLAAAAEYNLDISRGGAHFSIMMDMYMLIYTDCLYN